jgi:formate hydrogenlyase subunit 6/NADH:ubiquinone oxidoreductase subunit I
MDYERAFCQFECVACTEVCPTGAISLLSVAEKTVAAIAKSKLDLGKCIVVEKGTRCGACAEHCPSGALSMGKVPGAVHPGPVLDNTLCIGCGACETVCPSEPVKALVVSGLRVHETARVLPVRPGSGAQSSPETDIGEVISTPGKGDPSQGAPPGVGPEGFAF